MIQAPKVEVEVRERGGRRETIVTFKTPYGATIATLAVTDRLGFNCHFAVHDVTYATRDEDTLDVDVPILIGATHPVKVPLSSGEKKAAAEGRFP